MTDDSTGRYVCYGTVAVEREDNTDIAASDQRPPEEVVYSTDDQEEARAIKRNGGFVADGSNQWTVVTRVVDSQADKPASDAVRKAALSKRDFDQTP